MLFFVSGVPFALGDEKPGDLAKIKQDRERLIDLVISLQKDFGTTLRDHAQLQKDYATLMAKKEAPDQSAKVSELQKKLQAALTRLQNQKPAPREASSHAQLEQDLVNLRNELHRERQELLIARARLLRLQELEKQHQILGQELAAEKKSRTATAAELKTIQAERDALLGKLQGNMAELAKAQKAREALALRLETVAKENTELKKTVNRQATRLAELSKIEAEHQKALAAAAELRKENTRLTEALAEREKQLANLRQHLAAEVKRTLDIPVLIRARDELEKKLTDTRKDRDALATRNKTLTTRKTELEKEITTVRTSIEEMRSQLEKNKTAMASVAALTRENNRLKTDNTELEETIEMAKAKLVKAMGARNRLEAELAESKKIAATADNLRQKNDALLEEQDLLSNRLQNTEATLKASHQLTDELQASMLTLAKEKAELTQVIEAHEAEIEKLQAANNRSPEMAASLAKLEQEKKDLATRLARREQDLKQTRTELGRLQLSATVAQKKLADLKRTRTKIDPVRYNLGGTKITTQQNRVLEQVRTVLKNFPQARFEIVGHTCDLGDAATNLKLSRERAQSLHHFLVSKGIKPGLLSHRGVGQTEPMVPNTSEANRRLNRRVVVEILD